MNEIFSKGPANFRNEAFATGDKDKQNISFAKIRKMSSQHRHRHQLSHNFLADADSAKNVLDLMLQRKDYKSIKRFIQEIQSNPFGVLLISDIQAKLWALIKEKDPIWYFDATGSIMAKLPNQKETLLFSIVANDSKNKTSISLADFLTSSNDTISINCYLTKILQKIGYVSQAVVNSVKKTISQLVEKVVVNKENVSKKSSQSTSFLESSTPISERSQNEEIENLEAEIIPIIDQESIFLRSEISCLKDKLIKQENKTF
ncbi:unnamed protein product [Brachionus calyciflorus]|uniref:Uncharacterized protein n=1 Tax=Brachionus calyciflorus TaxID=104777 RepID=A0A814KD37_9BILA|nr:unnamed protein product [Brachionus calyciflorus]